MNSLSFVIIDENSENANRTKHSADCFSNLHFLGFSNTHTESIDLVLKYNPDLVFLSINKNSKSDISLSFIDELHRFLDVIPKIVIISKDNLLCYDAIKYGVFDYILEPLEQKELRKTIARLTKEISINKRNKEIFLKTTTDTIKDSELSFVNTKDEIEYIENKDSQPQEIFLENTFLKTKDYGLNSDLVICVKSYGDYRYIDAKSIRFLTSDNNSTDIHLDTGEVFTAFKTLKAFEKVLTHPFYRIHHSCIANAQHISRIHTGNATCYVKNTNMKLRFSKTYRNNIDQMIKIISAGNYIEI